MAETSLPVERLFTLTATLNAPTMIQDGPQGTRVIVDVTGGTFVGPKLKGTVAASGADWVTRRADGSAKLDVRITLLTEDGAAIFMTYNGISNQGAIRTAPLFETGAEQYAWLNRVQAVGVGKSSGGTVTYEVYQLL